MAHPNALSYEPRYRLNAICPYFTMFPLTFPLRILKGAGSNSAVLDPFCGRGTTNFAARILGLPSFGIDASPVAVAIARAKLAQTTPKQIIKYTEELLRDDLDYDVPQGAFWNAAFHPYTLDQICRIRAGLLGVRHSHDAVMLRALMLGCLHGPRALHKMNSGYFSNQMPRTFSPKPRYAVRYWRKHGLKPRKIDILKPLTKKAQTALSSISETSDSVTNIICADSQRSSAYRDLPKITHVVTSPPYYGLRTYVEDQWLRNWFLGGPADVPYGHGDPLDHGSPELFAKSLATVWSNISAVASPNVRMVIRFGAISSRAHDPRDILRESLTLSNHDWRIVYTRDVGNAGDGKRQAQSMGAKSEALTEYDFFVSRS